MAYSRKTENGKCSTDMPKTNGHTPVEETKPSTMDMADQDIQFPSIIDIKRVLPKHCFQPQLTTSMFYVFKDVTFIGTLYLAMRLMELQPLRQLEYAFIPVYWVLQGTLFWSVFVLGHDCGHESFSNHSLLNNIMGHMLHSFLLVPFYPWKISHRHHHKNTGNIDKEEIFYPIRQKDCDNDFTPFSPAFGFGLSWFMYLFAGYNPRKICHFNPFEPMFMKNAFWCITSILCDASWLALVLWYGRHFGVWAAVSHYGVPLFIFASWLVVATFLHHNEVATPWYSDERWDNVRGQLSTVDRDYGWAHHLTHHIGTHQVHHLFTKVPHYHLEEATTHFRRAFPHLVRKCDDPILPAFFRMFRIYEDQRHIHDDTKIHVYKPIAK